MTSELSSSDGGRRPVRMSEADHMQLLLALDKNMLDTASVMSSPAPSRKGSMRSRKISINLTNLANQQQASASRDVSPTDDAIVEESTMQAITAALKKSPSSVEASIAALEEVTANLKKKNSGLLDRDVASPPSTKDPTSGVPARFGAGAEIAAPQGEGRDLSNRVMERSETKKSLDSLDFDQETQAKQLKWEAAPARKHGRPVFEVGGGEVVGRAKKTSEVHPQSLIVPKCYPDFDTQSTRSQAPSVFGFQSVQSSGLTRSGRENNGGDDTVKLEKKQRFFDNLTMVSSVMYAVALVMLGLAVYLLDTFYYQRENGISEYFSLYLCLFGIVWLIYLYYDIEKYQKQIQNMWRTKGTMKGHFELVEGPDGDLLLEMPIPNSKKLPEYYCFASGRHSGSMFLKTGAALFCLGHLVHMGLQLGKQIVIFSSDKDYYTEKCAKINLLLFDLIYPIFSFIQLFMIFKYSHVVVNRNKGVARFAFMHCLASSLCLWSNTIINETMDGLILKQLSDDKKGNNDTASQQVEFSSSFFESDFDKLLRNLYNCSSEHALSRTIFSISPYLYPFTIEYSILIVGIWYIMWSNIGKVQENKEHMQFLNTPRGSIGSTSNVIENEALFVYADCHSTTKGLFGGLLVIVSTITTLIIFFMMENSAEPEISIVVNDITEGTILFIMIGASVVVYKKIIWLEINVQAVSFLDDLLLLICIPSFFLYAFISILPSVSGNVDWGTLLTNVMMLAQVIIQTPLIIDGLRRCSDKTDNRVLKPGRNMLTFLIVCNLAVYVIDTLEVRSTMYQKNKIRFYGVELWTFLSHAAQPLCIFYRFHSAVALVDVWNSAYKPGEH